MRSFFLFIIHNYAIFLFILLELLSLGLVFRFDAYHRTWFINSANGVTGNVLNTYGSFRNYFVLRQVNDSLVKENARLREALHPAADDTTHTIVRSASGAVLYTYVPAVVISNSITEPNNYMTIDKGSADGIHRDMGVISSSGIAGKVIATSPHFSLVMSVLNSDFACPVAVKKNNEQGKFRWSGKDPQMIQMVNVSEPGALAPGDTIVTTPASSVFPPDIVIGTLVNYGKDPGKNFYTLDIRLATKMSNIRYVYVVDYLASDELNSLRKDLPNASH